MYTYKKLDVLIKNKNGVVTFKDCKDNDIHHEYLKKYIILKKLEKVSRGVYITPNTWEDQMYIIQLQSKKAIFSHETALYLHELTDRDPLNYDVTVPSGYNVTCLKNKGLNSHSVKKDFYNLGLVKVKSMFGNTIITYDIERTICDCVKNRNNMDVAMFTDALKFYVRRKDKNIKKLYDYARKFRLEKIINSYMEVLL